MTRLKNKVAVITGGSGGIGLAAGKIFALEGAKVLLVDLDDEILRQAVETIGSDAVDYTVADKEDLHILQAIKLIGNIIEAIPLRKIP